MFIMSLRRNFDKQLAVAMDKQVYITNYIAHGPAASTGKDKISQTNPSERFSRYRFANAELLCGFFR